MADGLWSLEDGEHEMGDVCATDGGATAQVLVEGGPVGAGERDSVTVTWTWAGGPACRPRFPPPGAPVAVQVTLQYTVAVTVKVPAWDHV